MDCLHSERFCDAGPRQVHAQLLSEGTVLASVSTFYRRLRKVGQSGARRLQRPQQRHTKPQLTATAPHQVWTWDITKLPTLSRGVYLNLYLILDLFSRYVVGWMISRKENAGLAKHLFTRTLAAHAIAHESLIVHQDRGSPMTAHSFTDLLSAMGVQRSYSRPRVSNDNPFSESQFKTLKYSPSYPGRFADPEHAREWTRSFLAHYNDRPHEGLALFTPADVFHGRVDAVAAPVNAHWTSTTRATSNATSTAHRLSNCRRPPYTSTPIWRWMRNSYWTPRAPCATYPPRSIPPCRKLLHRKLTPGVGKSLTRSGRPSSCRCGIQLHRWAHWRLGLMQRPGSQSKRRDEVLCRGLRI